MRRAQPHLGTLVEIGVRDCHGADAAIGAAFARIAAIEARLSRFMSGSEIACFNAAPSGAMVAIDPETRWLLDAAVSLRDASDGLFDITLGSGASDWHCDDAGLRKHTAAVRLDLGGIGKGFAVDAAIAALRTQGVAAGWVNAGGDLRVFGALTLPIDLRDERAGGVRRFATLADGAFATSRLVPDAARAAGPRHASVAASECVWADALTKIVIASGDATHPLLARYDACAWLH